MRQIVLALAALSLPGGAVIAETLQQPIALECVQTADLLEIRVVGQSAAKEESRFQLDVISQGRGGTTNTVQRGSNRVGGPGGTLLQSRINTHGLTGWTARLHVTGPGGEYTLLKSM